MTGMRHRLAPAFVVGMVAATGLVLSGAPWSDGVPVLPALLVWGGTMGGTWLMDVWLPRRRPSSGAVGGNDNPRTGR
jgi:hypothetical protein